MPIYEYQCEKCQERREEMQGVNDPLLETCPSCGGKLRKLMSAPAFQFKGSGWYVTDYGKGGSTGTKSSGGDSGDSSGDSSSSSSSDDSSAKKVESKPDSTSSGSKEKSA